MNAKEILARIDEIENKIPHVLQMYNNGMQNNDRGRAKFWKNARMQYQRELNQLYAKLDILTQ